MKTDHWIILAILLWLLWPRKAPAVNGQVAFVGWTPEGQPVPLTPAPEPVMLPIPTELSWDSHGWPPT